MKTRLITALALLAAWPAAAQEAEDITARLNRMPGQAAAPAPRPEPEPAPPPPAQERPAPPVAATEAEDITARLNRRPGTATQPDSAAPEIRAPAPEPDLARPPEPQPEPPTRPEPERPAPTPDPAPDPGDIEPPPTDDAAIDDAAASPAPEAPHIVAPATAPFRVDLPPGFNLVERPSGPDFDIYQVSRGETPFVGIYVGCCSSFPIYDGRQAQAADRYSVLSQENGVSRAVEHLFVRESDGRQIHVWLHSVTGEDRIVAERIAQTVDPR